MSFQEEPESQIGFPIPLNTDEQYSPPPFDCGTNVHTSQKPRSIRNSDAHGSDDTVLDESTTLISSPVSQDDVMGSQVEETQFVSIERDTQPSIDYDSPPSTRKVLESKETSSAEVAPPMMAVPPLERQETPAIHNGPEFRFAKPPNPANMKLTIPRPGRSLPCQKEFTERKSSMSHKGTLPVADRTTVPPVARPKIISASVSLVSNGPTTRLPSSCDSSQSILNIEEGLNSSIPRTQTETTLSMGHAAARGDDVTGADGQQIHSQRMSLASSFPITTEEVSPQDSGRYFEEAKALSSITMRTKLVETTKSHSIPNNSRLPVHSSRQAKFSSPPFIDAALNNNTRRNTTRLPTTATPLAGNVCTINTPNTLRTVEAENATSSHSASSPVLGPFENNCDEENAILTDHSKESGDVLLDLPDVTNCENFETSSTLQLGISTCGLHASRDVFREPSQQRPRSCSKNANRSKSRQGTNETPPMGPTNRPLPENQAQPQDVRQNQDAYTARDSRVQKRGFTRASSAHNMQSTYKASPIGSKAMTAADLLQMATVMSSAEKGQLDKAIAEANLRAENLSKDNAALQDSIERLSAMNQDLLKKNAEFRTRSENYKRNMNDVMRSQKELDAHAKNLDRRKFELLRKSAKEMDVELLKAKVQASEDYKKIVKEAHLELDRQNKTIELLNRDINNRLLDLQRERGLRETLQKQLENRDKQQEELKGLIFDHQRNVVAILSSHEVMLKDILNADTDNTLRLTECQALVKRLNESEPKPIPALVELNELIVALSERVEKKSSTAEDDSIKVRDAGIEVLSELKHRLKLISEDQTAQRRSDKNIADLREENAKLKERIQNREMQFSEVEKNFIEIKQELRQCRTQLMTANEELTKAKSVPSEDVLLRTQLHDLQSSYSVAKKQAETSECETERVRANLREQERLTLLAEQEIIRLKDELRQSEAKASTFQVQREAYIRQEREQSTALRVQMERDVQARLSEEEARHNGIISGLRRQILDSHDKLTQNQQKLHDMEETMSNKKSESHILSGQISTIAIELGSLQNRACLMEQSREQTDCELRASQQQLVQYMEEAVEWSAQAEQNALEFAKRYKFFDDVFRKSEKSADAELARLEALVSILQKEKEKSDTMVLKIMGCLRSKESVIPDFSLSDDASELPSEVFQQEDTAKRVPGPTTTSDVSGIPSLSQQSTSRGPGKSFEGSTTPSNTKQVDSSAKASGEFISPIAKPTRELYDGDCRTKITPKESFLSSSHSKSPSKMTGQEANIEENDYARGSLELKSALSVVSTDMETFPATEAEPCLDPLISNKADYSNTHFGNKRILERILRTVVPDSQEELAQKHSQAFTLLPQSFAENPLDMAESSGNITRTEFSEYNLQMSETYIDKSTMQHNDGARPLFESQASDLSLTDSDGESSELSEPPNDVDEFDLADFSKSDNVMSRKDPTNSHFPSKTTDLESMAIHPMLSPRPNSSRLRASPIVNPRETRQPKGILKRTNSVIRIDNTVANVHSYGKPSGNPQPPNLQGSHRGPTIKKRFTRKGSRTKGTNSTMHRSLYNRPVLGSKDLYKNKSLEAQDAAGHEQGQFTTDVYTISSSPVMGQPQRNSKKRALSGVGQNDDNRPTKLPRSVRHLA